MFSKSLEARRDHTILIGIRIFFTHFVYNIFMTPSIPGIKRRSKGLEELFPVGRKTGQNFPVHQFNTLFGEYVHRIIYEFGD
jgi:hypothetical protein